MFPFTKDNYSEEVNEKYNLHHIPALQVACIRALDCAHHTLLRFTDRVSGCAHQSQNREFHRRRCVGEAEQLYDTHVRERFWQGTHRQKTVLCDREQSPEQLRYLCPVWLAGGGFQVGHEKGITQDTGAWNRM